MTDSLAEHRAALARIDDAVARAQALAGAALQCQRGCDACCVGGLTVLPVEAALIEEALADRGAVPARVRRGMCAFLDADGACTVYDARPVLCRTHGLALRASPASGPTKRALTILGDDVSACALNYTERAPAAAEVLDAEKLLMLLTTVDRRYRARAGLPDDTSRVALQDVAARARRGAGR